MEELSNRCEKLQLIEQEEEKVDLDDEEVAGGWVLARKFLSKRHVNLEAVVKVLKPIWKTTENFEVRYVGDYTTLFLFHKEEDMNRVL